MPENNPIDNIFRKCLKDIEKNPPLTCHENIFSALKSGGKKKHSGIFYWAYGVAALLAISLYFYNFNSEIKIPKEAPAFYSGVLGNSKRPYFTNLEDKTAIDKDLQIVNANRVFDQPNKIESFEKNIFAYGFTTNFLNNKSTFQDQFFYKNNNWIDFSKPRIVGYPDTLKEKIEVQVTSNKAKPAVADAAPFVFNNEELNQDDSQKAKWLLASTFSPDIRIGQNSGQTGSTIQDQLAFSTGIRLGYSIGSRWTFQSGVLYADRGNYQILPDARDNFSSSIYPARSAQPVVQRSQLVDIPLVIRYDLNESRLLYYLSAGISANIVGGNSSFLVSAGGEYRIKNKFSFSMEPTFRRFLVNTQVVSNSSLGLTTGLNYRF